MSQYLLSQCLRSKKTLPYRVLYPPFSKWPIKHEHKGRCYQVGAGQGEVAVGGGDKLVQSIGLGLCTHGPAGGGRVHHTLLPHVSSSRRHHAES